MKTLAFRLLLIYSLIFSSQLLIDLFFGSLATMVKLFLIFILWVITFWKVRKQLNKQERKLPDKILVIMTTLMAFMGIFSIYREIPIIVCVFFGVLYISFYPLVYLCIYIQKNFLLFKGLLLFLMLLSNVIALGIIWDSQGGLLDLPVIGDRLATVQQEWADQKEVDTYQRTFLGQQRRGGFFIGGSTSVYPILSVGCLANVLFFALYQKSNKKLILLAIPNFIIIWLGAFFSLSRTPLILTTIMCLYGVSDVYSMGRLRHFARQSILIVLIVGLIVMTPIIQAKLFENLSLGAITRYEQGFSDNNGGNLIRYQAWREGIMLFTDWEAWIGYGVGTSNLGARNYIDSRLSRYHYESTLLSDFSESGILGLLTRLLPYIVIIAIAKQTPKPAVFIVWSCLIIINLFAAPIGGYTSLYPSFLVLGLSLSLRMKNERRSIY